MFRIKTKLFKDVEELISFVTASGLCRYLRIQIDTDVGLSHECVGNKNDNLILRKFIKDMNCLNGNIIMSKGISTVFKFAFENSEQINMEEYLATKKLMDAWYAEEDEKHKMFLGTGGVRELYIKDKRTYFNEHSPMKYDFDSKVECIHCESVFPIKDYKVIAGMNNEYIVCKNHPICDGTVCDWLKSKKKVKDGKIISIYNNDRQQYDEIIQKRDKAAKELFLGEESGFHAVSNSGLRLWKIETDKDYPTKFIVTKNIPSDWLSEVRKIIIMDSAGSDSIDELYPCVVLGD